MTTRIPRRRIDLARVSRASAVAVNDTTLHVPALRVPLTSILTWWVTDFVTQKENPSSVGFGVGVVLPFN